MRELGLLLDKTFRHVAEALPGNAAASVVDGKLRLDRLQAEPEPVGMDQVRKAVAAMIPTVDFPELLLEVDARTGMFGAFEHISGGAARTADLEISLTALLVSKATNIGLEPVVKPGDPALTRGRLVGADYGYFNLPGIRAASAQPRSAPALGPAPAAPRPRRYAKRTHLRRPGVDARAEVLPVGPGVQVAHSRRRWPPGRRPLYEGDQREVARTSLRGAFGFVDEGSGVLRPMSAY